MGYINRKTNFTGDNLNDGRLMSADEVVTHVMTILRSDMKEGYKPKFIYRKHDFDDKSKMSVEIKMVKTDEDIPELKDAQDKGLKTTYYGVRDF